MNFLKARQFTFLDPATSKDRKAENIEKLTGRSRSGLS